MSVETPWKTETLGLSPNYPRVSGVTTIGSDTAIVRSRRSGGQAYFTIHYRIGSDTVLTGGRITFSLLLGTPPTSNAGGSPQADAGSAFVFDASAAGGGDAFAGSARFAGGNGGLLTVYPAFAAGILTDTNPVTLATGDLIVVTGAFQAFDN